MCWFIHGKVQTVDVGHLSRVWSLWSQIAEMAFWSSPCLHTSHGEHCMLDFRAGGPSHSGSDEPWIWIGWESITNDNLYKSISFTKQKAQKIKQIRSSWNLKNPPLNAVYRLTCILFMNIRYIRPACACALTASGVDAHAPAWLFSNVTIRNLGCDDTVVSRRRSFTSVRTTTVSFGHSTCFPIDLVVSLSLPGSVCCWTQRRWMWREKNWFFKVVVKKMPFYWYKYWCVRL